MGKLSDFEKLQSLLKMRYQKYLKAHAIHISYKDYLEMRREFCPICAKQLKDSQYYFGEEVCGVCKQDLDPDSLYSRHLRGKAEFNGRGR